VAFSAARASRVICVYLMGVHLTVLSIENMQGGLHEAWCRLIAPLFSYALYCTTFFPKKQEENQNSAKFSVLF
ncbi:MAG: hypothetical protein IIV80_06740, partial [Clostridia bacterium]|nr:hypothetical protein [Clostridia bacterium]